MINKVFCKLLEIVYMVVVVIVVIFSCVFGFMYIMKGVVRVIVV